MKRREFPSPENPRNGDQQQNSPRRWSPKKAPSNASHVCHASRGRQKEGTRIPSSEESGRNFSFCKQHLRSSGWCLYNARTSDNNQVRVTIRPDLDSLFVMFTLLQQQVFQVRKHKTLLRSLNNKHCCVYLFFRLRFAICRLRCC